MSIQEISESVYPYIGQRIRERRKTLKMSQSRLAELMGFSYQQMQKYENGSSQASVGRLLQFAMVLNVPPVYLYEGVKINHHIGSQMEVDTICKSRSGILQVLLVEDNPADVLLFRKALAACAEQVDLHVIHKAETVGDYLQHHESKYGKSAPDLVVLDLCLPKISGMRLLKYIKGNSETTSLPVIILTNSISKKDMEDAYRGGAAGFLQKSVDMEQYMNSIEATMQYWSRAVTLPCM